MASNAPLQDWQQGDVCMKGPSLPFLADFENFDEFECNGIVVVSQTCDVVRSIDLKPLVQIAAVLSVPEAKWEAVAKFHQPRYAALAKFDDLFYVADLDVVITIAKEALRPFTPIRGCPAPADQANFAYALARHRARAAFPDKCTIGLSKLRQWVRDKWKTTGEIGDFLKALEQMRLWADDLEDPKEAQILCVLDAEPDPQIRAKWVEAVIPKIVELVADWCAICSVSIQTLEELTVADYRRYQRLDFDSFSLGRT